MTTVPYTAPRLTADESLAAARAFEAGVATRRSLRHFSAAPVARAVIESVLRSAGAAPSGAHKQPWTFCAVADPAVKARIRAAAEREEYENYHGRMSDAWLADLAPLGTDHRKPFLETAPWLIAVFRRVYEVAPDGSRAKNYYVGESVGIACGFLLAALHAAGLVALTHTPSPMNFLQAELGRPANERPFLLIPVGYPPDDARVPDLTRKPLAETAVFY